MWHKIKTVWYLRFFISPLIFRDGLYLHLYMCSLSYLLHMCSLLDCEYLFCNWASLLLQYCDFKLHVCIMMAFKLYEIKDIYIYICNPGLLLGNEPRCSHRSCIGNDRTTSMYCKIFNQCYHRCIYTWTVAYHPYPADTRRHNNNIIITSKRRRKIETHVQIITYMYGWHWCLGAIMRLNCPTE